MDYTLGPVFSRVFPNFKKDQWIDLKKKNGSKPNGIKEKHEEVKNANDVKGLDDKEIGRASCRERV